MKLLIYITGFALGFFMATLFGLVMIAICN